MDWNNINLKTFKLISEVNIEDETDRNIKILSILFNTDVDYFYSIPYGELTEWLKRIAFLSTLPPDTPPKKEYIINGKKYKANLDVYSWNVAAFIDFGNHQKAGNDLAYVISTFLLPVVEVEVDYKKWVKRLFIKKREKVLEYGEYDIFEVIEDLNNHMSIVDALVLSGFFLRLFRALSLTIQQYGIKGIRKKLKDKSLTEKERQILEKALKELISQRNSTKSMVGGCTT